jgi:hypothetical protein
MPGQKSIYETFLAPTHYYRGGGRGWRGGARKGEEVRAGWIAGRLKVQNSKQSKKALQKTRLYSGFKNP